MTLLTIRTVPDPVLRVGCAPVTDFGANLGVVAADMLETMYDAYGRGLSAPQIGLTLRFFVMDADWKTGAPVPGVFVNPEITWASESRQVLEEACLSIPRQSRRIARPAEIRVAWQDEHGRAKEGHFIGPAATIVQHEIDHLNGILTIDHDAVPLPDKPAP